MAKAYHELVDALQTSVIEITTANPADRDERLAKSFASFKEHLEQRLGEDLPLGAGEADPVSTLADSLSGVQRAIDMVESGACLAVGGAQLSPAALTLAKCWADLGEIAVRVAATDFAEPVEDGAGATQHESLVKVASSGGETLVKTALPEAAATLITDPADSADALVTLGIDLLETAGLAPRDLVEIGFGALGQRAQAKLAKRLAKRAKAPRSDEGSEDPDDPEGLEDVDDRDDPEGLEDPDDPDDPEDGSEGFEPGGDDPEGMEQGEGGPEPGGDPLSNIAGLGSMILVELAAMRERLPPGAEGGAGGELSALDALGQHAALITVTAEALQGAVSGGAEYQEPNVENGPPVDGGAPEPVENEDAEKAMSPDELKKAISESPEMAAMRKQLEEVTGLLQALGHQPAAPAAIAGRGAALTKAADSGGQDNGLPTEADLNKMVALGEPGREEAALALMKFALKTPVHRAAPIRS